MIMVVSRIILVFLAICGYSYSSEKSLYHFNWLEPDEKVFIIQNKEYIKKHRFGLDLNYLTSDSSSFQTTNGIYGVLAFYLSEEFSLDIAYKNYFNKDNSDHENLKKVYATPIKPLVRKFNSGMLARFNWIPFYGKLNAFNYFYYFDLGTGIGIGKFQTESNYETFNDQLAAETYKEESNTGVNFRLFFKFHMSRKVNLNLEYSHTRVKAIMNAQKQEDTISFTDLAIGIGMLF